MKSNFDQCQSCKYLVLMDYGYSNWTVEGTDAACGKNMFEPFDRFYGEAPEIKTIPINCQQKEHGEPIYMDVDGEDYNQLTDEEKTIYDSVK